MGLNKSPIFTVCMHAYMFKMGQYGRLPHTLPEKFKQNVFNLKKNQVVLSRLRYAYDIHVINSWLMSPSSPGKWLPAPWRNILHLPPFIPS